MGRLVAGRSPAGGPRTARLSSWRGLPSVARVGRPSDRSHRARRCLGPILHGPARAPAAASGVPGRGGGSHLSAAAAAQRGIAVMGTDPAGLHSGAEGRKLTRASPSRRFASEEKLKSDPWDFKGLRVKRCPVPISYHGLRAVAQLKLPPPGGLALQPSGLHGLRAVTQLKHGGSGAADAGGGRVSTAFGPWPN
jgi:hypothetical protein